MLCAFIKLMSIKKNTAWNLFGAVAPLFLAIFCIPFIITNAGTERFGILTIIWTMIGYFSLFDFGLGRALTQRISFYIDKDNLLEVEKVVFNGVLITGIAGGVGSIIFALLAYPLAYYILNISEYLMEESFYALLITAIGIFFSTLSSAARGVMEAFEEFKNVNIVKFVLGASNFLSPFVSITFLGNSVVFMAIFMVGVRFLTTIIYLILIKRKNVFCNGGNKFCLKTVKDILPFGAWMSVSNIVGPIMVSFDRFFISNFAGAQVVAFYTVPVEIFSKILLFPGALASSLFPKFSAASLNVNNYSKKLYIKSFFLCTLILLIICSICFVFSRFGIELWLGKDFAEKAGTIAKILIIGVFFNGIAIMPYTYLQANNFVKLTARIHLCELICYIPVLILLTNAFSLEGAALSWALRAAIDFGVMKYFAWRLI